MRKRTYTYPWRGDNQFTLLIDGEQIFPRMLEAVRMARSHVLLEMYLFKSGSVADRFVEALTVAAGNARVYLLLDDFGARGLSQRDRSRLLTSGVHLVFFNPLQYGRWVHNLLRDHRKLLLVDDKVAYVGGIGLADEFDPPAGDLPGWHDTAIEIRGSCVEDWRHLFIDNWQRLNGAPPILPPARVGGIGSQQGRVSVGYGAFQAEMQRSLVARMRSARRRVWLATAYFIPSWKVRRTLRRTARRGIDVRLLLPGPYSDHPSTRYAGRRFYYRLLRAGVRIFEYQPRFLHAKMFVCDDWTSIGSCNIDRWNLRWNLEANQEVADPRFSNSTAALFEEDFRLSREYRLEQWERRAWHRRMLEWFWGLVDIWLERRGRH